eukprot:GCRY01001385.1.p1 GENE.GCRY01001385.1~~GCRY01001385.1.p1  ORF type:complete len:903 (-),score=265.26 GCRY01001385.1:361-3069(-)
MEGIDPSKLENLPTTGKIIANSKEEVDELMKKIEQAQEEFSTFPQEQVDLIFGKVAYAAANYRMVLAKMAHRETQMGVFEDKVVKNNFAAEMIHNKYKDSKTCGEIEVDEAGGVVKVAEPIGIIAAILPCTNPTSTCIYKTLLALKTRNAIAFAPHPRAKECSAAAAVMLHKAAVEAGAPEYLLGIIGSPSIELTTYLIKHESIDLVLATGGPGMIEASYSSGKPAVTGGAGNSPVVIDESADIEMAVNSIIMSKMFDHGLICASEQSVIVMDSIYEKVKEEMKKRGCMFLNDDQIKQLEKALFPDGHRLNAKLVGQSATMVGEAAGFPVPQGTRVLVAEIPHIGEDQPLSREKLTTVLAMLKGKDFDEAVTIAVKAISFGGLGHTCALYCSEYAAQKETRIFRHRMPAGRVLINTPTTFGAIGDLYNFRTIPGLTIACGSWGGNATSDVVSLTDLLNIKTVATKRENMLWFQIPKKVYFRCGILKDALSEELVAHKNRVLIITDSVMIKLGYVKQLTSFLVEKHIDYDIFSNVAGEPTDAMVKEGITLASQFQPDVMIALGGGSAIDACKMIRLLYEEPHLDMEQSVARFMDIRKKVVKFPQLGTLVKKVIMVPTTSGTGAEVTPFAVISSKVKGVHRKYAIADYALTPDVAIIDATFCLKMPPFLVSNTGLDALTHALEAHVSVMASEYTQGISLKSCQLLFQYLRRSYQDKAGVDLEAKERVHNAASMAGMAFANAFLGVCHSLAHAFGGTFHLPHGLCNSIFLPHVIRYNSHEAPTKVTPYAQYKKPLANRQYAEIARSCHLATFQQTDAEAMESLVHAVEDLSRDLNLAATFQAAGVNEDQFLAKLDILAELAFDDQCTGCNPRFAMVPELKELFLDGYYGAGKRSDKYLQTLQKIG